MLTPSNGRLGLLNGSLISLQPYVVGLLLALTTAEVLTFVAVNAAFDRGGTDGHVSMPVMAVFITRALKYIIGAAAISAVLLAQRFHAEPNRRIQLWWIAVHLALLCGLLVIRGELKTGIGLLPFGSTGLTLAYALVAAGWLLSGVGIANTLVAWRKITPWQTLTLSVSLPALVVCAVLFEKHFRYIEWAYASILMPITANLVGTLLEWFGYEVSIDTSTQQVSVDDFSVTVAAGCLGYQGWSIGLAAVGSYLIVNRARFRFPQALLVLPAMLGVLFVANLCRITALLAIGASVSPAIAVNGFHVGSGAILLILVTLGVIFVLERVPGFATVPIRFELTIDDKRAQLLPFGFGLALALLTTLVTADFDWFYPLRTLAVGVAILWLWPYFKLSGPSPVFIPVAAGVMVAIAWVVLIPADAAKSASFAGQLFREPNSHVLLWIAFRILGAAVIVPVSEELVFRGYLFNVALSKADKIAPTGATRQVVAVGVTTLAFALLHGDFVASVVAGVIYGMVKLRRGSTLDAVVAHAVTNGLLTGYVVWSGHWSYW